MRGWIPIALGVAIPLLGTAPAAAVPLPPTQSPLPGSSFQGADGDQVDGALGIDWGTLQTTGQVEHTADPNAQDTAFAEGSTENVPGEWTLANVPGGVSPGQTNILDSWSSVDEPGADTFLYLAFARAAGTGTSYLTFELNRDARPWDNGRASVPCRLDEDVLVTFEPQGNAVNMFVQAWGTTMPDASTGCARTGSLGDAANLAANVDVQGAMNPAAIANALPGVAGATLPTAQFGETALNLGTVLGPVVGTACGAFTSVWMHSRSSRSPTSSMKDHVAPHEIDARRCSAAGTKWLDYDADGVRDPGDRGLAGFRIYADLNDNGAYELGEPFAISDEQGDYVIDDVPARGTYTLREEPTDAVPLDGPWTCSFPVDGCSWTVDADADPYARDRDFGNWRPARVTLAKQLDPPDDAGRFDLTVGGSTLPAAGDGDRETFALRPGTHPVGEAAAGGTNAADYDSSVACAPNATRAPYTRNPSTTITVLAGQEWECTFVNVRRGSPSVALQKLAPAVAEHGATLDYELVVTNTGSVSFQAADVEVTDPRCDDPPVLVERLGGSGEPDGSPGSLDPDDVWIYTCSRRTEPLEDPDACIPDELSNTGRVTVPGAEDSDTAVTELRCPEPREPGIAIQKIGPASAEAGTPLTYVLYVTNVGMVRFAEAHVTVSDPACDAPPDLVARFEASGEPDTASPERLDPDDVWVYECVSSTPDPGAACVPTVIGNTGTVVAAREGSTVDDNDTFATPLTCPPAPSGPEPEPTPTPPGPEPAPPGPEPAPPGPEPVPPVPVTPSGTVPDDPAAPVVPEAGTAGRAGLRPLRRCLRRGSRVVVRGSRIAAVRVFVRGRRVGGLRVRALQRRAVIHVRRDLRPGRHRVTARVRFQRGAGTQPVRLTRVVRACATRTPRFTG